MFHRSSRYVEQLPRSDVTPRTRAAAVSAVTCVLVCNDVTRDVEHLRGVRSFGTASGGATRRDYDKVVGICPNNLSAPFVRIARGRAGIIPRNYSRPAAAALFRATVGQHSRIFANGPRLWAGRPLGFTSVFFSFVFIFLLFPFLYCSWYLYTIQ